MGSESDVDGAVAFMICHTYWRQEHEADNKNLQSYSQLWRRGRPPSRLHRPGNPTNCPAKKTRAARIAIDQRVNAIRQTLKSGGTSVGSWMQLPCASVAEIMGRAGFDWVAVDLEHGSFAAGSLPDLFRALELGGTVPFARVAQNSAKDIKHAVDAGARGVIIPMIETRTELENAIAWAKYPPQGRRGVGFSRANLFGSRFAEYFASINDEIVLVAQIESIAAVHALDEILTVEGLDAIMVGPYDLSASMGLTGQFSHPTFIDAMKLTQSMAGQHGMPMGVHVVEPDPGQLRRRMEEGYRFLAYGIDAVFLHRGAINPVQTASV